MTKFPWLVTDCTLILLNIKDGWYHKYRSSDPEVFCKKGVLRYFAILQENTRPATLLK